LKNNKLEPGRKADIYRAPPKDVIVWMLKVLGKEKELNETEGDKGKFGFLSNMNKLQDLMQAKMLQALDKGIPIFCIKCLLIVEIDRELSVKRNE